MKTIVTITKVGSDWVEYITPDGESLSMSNIDGKKFPNVEKGQTWEVEINNSGQFPTGKFISAKIISPA